MEASLAASIPCRSLNALEWPDNHDEIRVVCIAQEISRHVNDTEKNIFQLLEPGSGRFFLPSSLDCLGTICRDNREGRWGGEGGECDAICNEKITIEIFALVVSSRILGEGAGGFRGQTSNE